VCPALGKPDSAALPRVSVVTVTLNAGEDLRATVNSVAAQAFGAVQHVVKDGLSSDGSTDFLSQRGGKVELVRERDDGVYDAMNQACAFASGEYVHFLNSGDCYSDDQALKAVTEAAQAAGRPELVVTWYRNLEHDVVRTCPESLGDWYLFRAALGHQAVYFRRDLLARLGGYDVSYRLLADHDLIFRALIKERVSYLVLPRVCVDYKGQGLSADPANAKLKGSEAGRLRRDAFPGARGQFYRLLHEATLWRLRTQLLRFSGVRKLYYACVAALNR
jgi:glycosyltransferase involved in cell wall biosynthesis